MAAHLKAYRKNNATGWLDWLKTFPFCASLPVPVVCTLPRVVGGGAEELDDEREVRGMGAPPRARPSSAAESSSAVIEPWRSPRRLEEEL